MAVLNDWQKITRVISGRPFGYGSDGNYSSATIPTMIKESCSGTSGNKTLTTAGTTLSNGDIVLLHQSRGTGVGQWEINRVTSGGGTTTITLQVNKQYTYTDSGSSQAQATVIKQYGNVTGSGTWTLPDWAGNTGGILVFASNGTATLGANMVASGKGFTGSQFAGCGSASGCTGFTTYTGEGSIGAKACSRSARGNGGGGGPAEGPQAQAYNASGGGGGGNGASGSTGGGKSNSCPPQAGGIGGATSGAADLITATFGGGGGTGGGTQGNILNYGGGGGDGGGLIFIFAKNLVITGTVVNGGIAGTFGNNAGGGGGGAGGSTLFVVQTATLGSNKATASGAAGGSAGSFGGVGGASGVGRIAVHHSDVVTGTTSPTFSDTTDASLIETIMVSSILE